jgi:hypothetical protein
MQSASLARIKRFYSIAGTEFMAKDFEREYHSAARRAAKADAVEPRAKSARYDKRSRRIIVDLRNGSRFIFPPDLAQGLAGADDRALSNIQLSRSGSSLSWPDLDADFSLPALMTGVFGTRQWMRKLSQRRRVAEQKA